MRAAIFITALILISGSIFSQSETAKIWTRTFNSGLKDVAVESAADESGNVYVAGYRSQTGSAEDSTARMLLIKYNPQGELLWSKTFNSRSGRRTLGLGLDVDDSGNAVVCGLADTNSFNLRRALVVKYNSDGDTLWVRYNGFYIYSWIYHDVRADAQGNVFLSYELIVNIPMPGKTSYAVKYNSSGNMEWSSQAIVNSTNPLIEVNAFGSVFLGSVTTIAGQDIKIANFDNTGTQQWIATYNSPGNGSDTLTGLRSDPVSGDLIAIGSSNLGVNSNIEIQTMKFSSGLGQLLWVKRTNGTAPNAYNTIRDFDVSTTGDVFICGQFTNNSTGLDGFLIRYNPSGNELYRKIYNFKGGLTEESITSVDADASNESVIAGYNGSKQNTFVQKHSTSGGITWKYVYNDSLDQLTERPVRVIKTALNQIYVVNGYSNASSADINVTMFNNIAVNQFYTCKSVNLNTIPGDNTYDTISVNTGTGNLVRMEVRIDSLTHADPKDLTIRLQTPHNTVIELFRNSGLSVPSTGLFGTVFSDSAQKPIDSGSVTYTGYYSPYQPLEPLNSYSPDGNWVLIIHNASPGDSGVLNKWCLNITYEAPVGIQTVGNEIPKDFKLSQNYPNPFNPVTNIKFSVPESGNVNLKVFDLLGREVAVLVNEFKPQGNYLVDFNASKLSSGVYFYRLEAGSFTETRKMVLIK